jgi:hypothetical protein
MKQQTNKTNMKDITIKSVIPCPTCNSECKVNDGITQYYVPTKKYTEADIIKAIELARETESVRRGALSEDWDDIEKYSKKDIINLLNKQV